VCVCVSDGSGMFGGWH